MNILKKFIEPNVIEKFYLATEHFIFSVLGVGLFWENEWFHDITMMDDWEFDIKIYGYYYIYFIRYLAHLIYLDRTRKDYSMMFIHHMMTLLLLFVSSFRYTRIGIIIAVNHDYADITLNLAKGFNKIYEKYQIANYDIISNLCLILFVITWTPTRIILNYNILDYIFRTRELPYNFSNIDLDEKITTSLLLLNFCLQCCWQIMIIRFVYNAIINKPSVDENGIEYKIS